MSTIPITTTAAEWLGIPKVPADMTIGEVIDRVQYRASERWPTRRVGASLAQRWPGHDPRPDIDQSYGIIEVYHWKAIVDRVSTPDTEIALEQLPGPVRHHRKVGQQWYETLAYVLLAGANLELRPPEERSLKSRPRE